MKKLFVLIAAFAAAALVAQQRGCERPCAQRLQGFPPHISKMT